MEMILGLVILAVDIWAIINIWGSSAGTGSKVLWTLGIIILPVVGAIAWYFMGPKSRTAIA